MLGATQKGVSPNDAQATHAVRSTQAPPHAMQAPQPLYYPMALSYLGSLFFQCTKMILLTCICTNIISFLKFLLLLLLFVWELHLAVLRPSSWMGTQGLSLAGLKGA